MPIIFGRLVIYIFILTPFLPHLCPPCLLRSHHTHPIKVYCTFVHHPLVFMPDTILHPHTRLFPTLPPTLIHTAHKTSDKSRTTLRLWNTRPFISYLPSTHAPTHYFRTSGLCFSHPALFYSIHPCPAPSNPTLFPELPNPLLPPPPPPILRTVHTLRYSPISFYCHPHRRTLDLIKSIQITTLFFFYGSIPTVVSVLSFFLQFPVSWSPFCLVGLFRIPSIAFRLLAF